MIYIANYGSVVSQAALNAINSFVALATTPAGSALTKDGSGNFVNTVISGGGTGTPGGSVTQLQYNLDAVNFGGITRATTDGTTVSYLANGILIKDQTDATKIAAFDASAITTGTTRTYILPDASGTLVLTTASQTLTNKTLGVSNIVTLQDNRFTLQDDGDNTKQLVWQLSGITTGTTRTITMPDASGTLTLLGNTSTGSGAIVLATSPTLVTPVLGVATATSINGLTITTSTGTLTITNAKTVSHTASTTFAGTDGKTLTVSNSGTLAGGDAFVLAIAAGKTLTVSNTLTFTGTDSSSVAFGAGGTVLYTTSAIPLTVGTTTIASGTNTRILYNNSGVLGEYTLTGTGTVVVMATAPTFATSITTPSVLATANDSGALGASGTAFSDLFLASGAVINFAANNAAITHSTGILTVTAGELRITSANVGTNGDSVPTLSSTSTFTNKTLTSPVITTGSYSGTQLLQENASVGLDPAGSADGKYSGITVTGTAGYTQAFGDLVYLDPTDSRWEACDANSASGADGDSRGMIGMVVVAGTDGNACTILLVGIIRADAKFPTFTINNPIYVSETAGAVTQTQPTTTDVVIRIVGAAMTADEMYFNPDFTWTTHT